MTGETLKLLYASLQELQDLDLHIIQTDEWRAYNEISKAGCYEHKKVVHKYNFVDPGTEFLFFDMFKDNVFDKIVDLIKFN